MRKSEIFPIALAFLFVFTGLSSAQQTPVKGHKGDKGISFSVSGLSYVGIGKLEGGIGGKYWISNKVALLGAFGVNASKTTGNHRDPGYSDFKQYASGYSLFAGVEDHFFLSGKISPYFGAGVRLTSSSTTYYPPLRIENPPPGATKKDKRDTDGFGIRGFCGIEYFLADWVSLAGQYQMDYSYQKAVRKRTLVVGSGISQPRDEKQTKTTLGVGTSSLVATFYIW